MMSGDVIMKFDGRDVVDTRGLVRQVGNTAVGKAVRVVVNRDGATETLMVTLGRREEAESAEAETPEAETPETPSSADLLGLSLTLPNAELAEEFSFDADMTGLVVTSVDESSEAFEKGMRAGDVITEAGRETVAEIADLEDRIAAAKEAGRKSILLLVRRSGDPRFVALTLEE